MALSSPAEKLLRSNTDNDDDSDDDDDETLMKKNHRLVYFLEFVKRHIKCLAVLASL